MQSRNRRVLLFALLVAVALGVALGWFARARLHPSPESRAQEALEGLREQARELTR